MDILFSFLIDVIETVWNTDELVRLFSYTEANDVWILML